MSKVIIFFVQKGADEKGIYTHQDTSTRTKKKLSISIFWSIQRLTIDLHVSMQRHRDKSHLKGLNTNQGHNSPTLENKSNELP